MTGSAEIGSCEFLNSAEIGSCSLSNSAEIGSLLLYGLNLKWYNVRHEAENI
jgi:hypothetical protein